MARRKAQPDASNGAAPSPEASDAASSSVPAVDPVEIASDDTDVESESDVALDADPSFVDAGVATDGAGVATGGAGVATDGADPAAATGAEAELPEPDDRELEHVLEALLFAASEPLTAARLADAAATRSPRRVKAAIERLRAHYRADDRAFDVLEIGGGYRLYSRPELAHWVARLEAVRAPERLSAAALETLAIIAYRQPIIRADIDAVRGVQSGAILKSLLDRKLIRVVGRSDRPGRPLLFGTARRFLDHFGLASVKDLPKVEDLKAP